MIIKSFIEDIIEQTGGTFHRELFAAAFPRDINLFRGKPAAGLKPAGAIGWDRGYLAAAQEYEAAVRAEENAA
jgi:hypothetical protein